MLMWLGYGYFDIITSRDPKSLRIVQVVDTPIDRDRRAP